tara:strand:+ start:6066 stop:6917 length:852 start_codon:yes stop_codon:yes gene_type:complete
MRVYKKKYIKKGFTPGEEWMIKISENVFEEYVGPIVFYVGTPFGGEVMNKSVQKNMKLYPYDMSKAVILYDELKPDYRRDFVEPVPYAHKLTKKEIEKGEYSRYFVEILNTGSVCEIDKEQHKYYKKNSTPYHKNAAWVEIKLKLSTLGITLNYESIQKAVQLIRTIRNYVLPTDHMKWPGILKGIEIGPDSRRMYPAGKEPKPPGEEEFVPGTLPMTYQLGNSETEQTNKIIPPRQNCGGCRHLHEGHCGLWDAKVRDEYWCAKYIYDGAIDPYYKPEIKLP